MWYARTTELITLILEKVHFMSSFAPSSCTDVKFLFFYWWSRWYLPCVYFDEVYQWAVYTLQLEVVMKTLNFISLAWLALAWCQGPWERDQCIWRGPCWVNQWSKLLKKGYLYIVTYHFCVRIHDTGVWRLYLCCRKVFQSEWYGVSNITFDSVLLLEFEL